MRKSFMKLTAIAIAVLLLTTALPFSASADTSGYYTYSISNGEATIIRCDRSISGDITIPFTLGGYPVTSIGSYAFQGCSNLTSITIPNSVTSIGNNAFRFCVRLTSIIIPDGVTSIGNNAFQDCSNLTSITVPNSVTSIGNGAFGGCSSLTSITIPDSVTSIDSSAFNNTAYYNNESNWENDVLYINNHLIKANSDLSGEYKIKDGICTIADSAFYNCSSLTSIKIGNGVTSIGDSAFWNCSTLTSITIPDSVKSIGDDAFSYCRSLTSITIPDSVTSIGVGTLANCSSLTSITIPNSVTSISDWAFCCCSSLTSITIPDGVTSIGDYAFVDCSSLTSINIPGSVTKINNCAFIRCDNLSYVFYTGTAQQWKNIDIGSDNDRLSKLKISAPTVQLIGATKLTVKAIEGYEYSIDGKVWQSSNLFTGLIPQSSYVVYARRTDLSEYTTVSLGASVITNGQDEVDTAPSSSNLVVLRKALIIDFNNMALDYNADGEINILDFIRLKKYLCGMNVMLGNKETSVMSFAAAPSDTNTHSTETPISEPYYSVASNINSEDITDRKIA